MQELREKLTVLKWKLVDETRRAERAEKVFTPPIGANPTRSRIQPVPSDDCVLFVYLCLTRVDRLQGYLAHKKTPPPRALQ